MTLPKYHGAQRAIAEASARFKVAMCGRRFGKSVLMETELIEPALDGWPVGYFAPNYKYSSPTFDSIRRTLSPIIESSNKNEGVIHLITGGSIEVWTLENKDAGRSRKYKRVAVDEAGLVRDLWDIWNNAIRPTLADYQGDALIGGTPKGRGDFHKMYLRGEDDGYPDWAAFRFGTIHNPAIPATEIEDARRELPEAAFRQEFEGIPSDDAGNPFGADNVRACIGPLSPSAAVVYGVDIARANDYTVIIGLDEQRRVCHFERWHAPSWAVVEQKLRDTVGSTPALIDQTGVGSPVMEQVARFCPNAEGFTFTNQSKQQIIEGLQLAFHRKDIVIPNDSSIIEELLGFGYTYRGGRIYFEAEGVEHDDCVCALALALHAYESKPRGETFAISVPRARGPFGTSRMSW